MGVPRAPRILRRMGVEPPIPIRPVLIALGAVMAGSYLLLAVLALAESANWWLVLLPLVVLAFAAAAYEGRGVGRLHD